MELGLNGIHLVWYSNDQVLRNVVQCCTDGVNFKVSHSVSLRFCNAKLDAITSSSSIQFSVNSRLRKISEGWVQKHAYGLACFHVDSLEAKQSFERHSIF